MADGDETTNPVITGADEDAITRWTDGDVSVVLDYATTHLAPNLFWAAIGLGVIFIGYMVAQYVSLSVGRPIRRRVDETLGKFVGNTVFYVILLGVVGAVLSKLGAPLGGLAAMLAAAGFAVGLAFQGTLSNFASGVMMLVFRPFKVGDVITAAGVRGKVNEIDLFTTTLDTADNRRIIVPNSAVSGGTIENISFHPHRRIEVVIGVDYSADLDQTRAAIQAATATFAAETIQGEGRGSAVVLSNLGTNSVQWKARMWVAAENYGCLLESLTAEVKRQLDSVNIGTPLPQLDVHLSPLDGDDDAQRERPRVRPIRRETDDGVAGDPIYRTS